ncbi:MAG TPA: hypothetical protein VFA46_13530 [Actinomycetes bacterium]|jgi:hypothetical protein|nr:hypothetical protein [Actinomycetes bacterium]
MRLLIDTSQTTFLVGSEVEAVVDFTTKQPKADRHGQPLYQMQLVCFFRDDDGKQRSETIRVRVPDLTAPPPGTPIKVAELVAVPWSNNGKNGVAYRAARIEPSDSKPARAAS